MGKKEDYPGGISPSRVSGTLSGGGRYGYRKDFRRQEAQERAEFRATLTPQQQITRLDKRLGAGVGAQKERQRLRSEIENAKSQRQAKKNREHSAKIAAEMNDA